MLTFLGWRLFRDSCIFSPALEYTGSHTLLLASAGASLETRLRACELTMLGPMGGLLRPPRPTLGSLWTEHIYVVWCVCQPACPWECFWLLVTNFECGACMRALLAARDGLARTACLGLGGQLRACGAVRTCSLDMWPLQRGENGHDPPLFVRPYPF